MPNTNEYVCPCCGGAIEFNATAQKMVCPFCDSEFSVEAVQDYAKHLQGDGQDDMSWEERNNDWSEQEAEGIRVYHCSYCGGEIYGDDNTAATTCPYCDNPVVMQGQVSNSLRPDYIIPFMLEKKHAVDAFKKHLMGKKFLPKVFKDENHIEEIKGMYVPFWLFDTGVSGTIRYKGTKTRHWSSGNYNYTETSHYSIVRGGAMQFDNIAIDGSSNMADDLMESVSPFDFRAAKPFSTAYLAGYVADKYDVTAEQTIDRANYRVRESVDTMFRKTVQGYQAVNIENTNLNLQNAKAKYALYPVWIMNTKWKGQMYMFAMNGQTGNFVGNLPLDKKKYWRTFFSLFLPITAGLYFLFWFVLGAYGL